MNTPPYDAIGTFLVFLIGVPALVIQFMPPEVRAIIMRRARHQIRFGLLAGMWILFALVVSTVGILTQLNCEPAADLTADVYCPIFPTQLQILDAWLWPVVFTLLSFITIGASLTVIIKFGRRNGIVGDWRNIATRIAATEGRLDPKALSDLLDLGRTSEAGLEKDIVLQALYSITEELYHSTRYEGDSLEQLLEGLGDVIASDPHIGNSRNFETVMDILQMVVAKVPIGENGPPPDLLHAVGALSNTGLIAVRHLKNHLAAKQVVSDYIITLNLAAERSSQVVTAVTEALRDLGIGAIETDQMFLAIKAFEKLESRIESQPEASVSGEVVCDTMALLAHFWTAGGTARGYVHKQMCELEPYLEGSLQDALVAARAHAARTSLFKTADLLDRMLLEYNP